MVEDLPAVRGELPEMVARPVGVAVALMEGVGE